MARTLCPILEKLARGPSERSVQQELLPDGVVVCTQGRRDFRVVCEPECEGLQEGDILPVTLVGHDQHRAHLFPGARCLELAFAQVLCREHTDGHRLLGHKAPF